MPGRRFCFPFHSAQNSPLIRPFSSTSIRSAAGTFDSPGMGTPRDRSRGDPAFDPAGQARPVQLKVLPPAKRLDAASAAV